VSHNDSINSTPDAAPTTRRRGRALEEALLAAALAQLIEAGYGNFTIEAVAERAATSRHVIYRRWATREDLALAAVKYDSEQSRQPIPDTGSLRGDVLALLTNANATRLTTVAFFSLQLSAYFQETGTSPAELRAEILGDREDIMGLILRRAAERDEIDPARVTKRMGRVAVDLLRHEAMLTLEPVSPQVILDIVDDIFMPLVSKR
jgi:AcrR family transcriptional regulator